MKPVKADLCHGAIRIMSVPADNNIPDPYERLKFEVGIDGKIFVKDTPEMRRNIARQLRVMARKFELSSRS